MSIQSIINELNVTFNNNVKKLLDYCNSQTKSIMNSKFKNSKLFHACNHFQIVVFILW